MIMQRTPDTMPMPAIDAAAEHALLAVVGRVQTEAGQGGQFQEGRTGVEQQRQALARQQLAALLERSREAADFSAVRVSTSRTRPISSSMPARLAWKESLLGEMVDSMMAMVNAG
jgi:hypothetical protein